MRERRPTAGVCTRRFATMKTSMRTKLEQLAKRLDEIDVHLSGEHAARDMNRFRSLGQERAEIEPVVSRFHDY